MFRSHFARLLFLLLLLPAGMRAQAPGFNADSAYAFVRHLTVEIGPRPMGSVNDRRALQWARQKFIAFGADTAYIMPIRSARLRGLSTNTRSGNAVAIFRGETDSSIVIGGHIDSAGPEFPGANDDASGTACMLELARLWSTQPRHYTLVFVAFSGEEAGLVGSRHFVEHYADLNKVVLMLQIDMAGSDESIIPFMEIKSHQTPRWLVEEVIAADRALGLHGFRYPTHFFTWNNIVNLGSSDQEPFLRKNIPAIDFTAGINTSPIHSQQDRIAFTSRAALARSGRLVDALLRKVQARGIPAPKQGHYMLWRPFGLDLFIPRGFLVGFDIVAVVLAVFAFGRSRRARLRIEKAQRARLTGWKLALMMLIIAVSAQAGEAVLQEIKNWRYPWTAPIEAYLWLAALGAVAGAWIVLQLTRRWRFSPDAYVYSKRALVLYLLYALVFWFGDARLAFYPALSLALFSLAIFLQAPRLKMIFAVLAPLPLARLLLMETLPFLGRNLRLIGFGIDSFWTALLFTAAITLVLFLWFLPALYSFGYAYVSATPPVAKRLQALRRPLFGAAILLALLGYGAYLGSLPAYDAQWRPLVHVDAKYDLRTGESTLVLSGNDYFRNLTLSADSLQRQYDGRQHREEIPLRFSADWLQITGSATRRAGEMDTISVDWRLVAQKPWFRTELGLRPDSLGLQVIEATPAYHLDKKRLRFAWALESTDTLSVRARLVIAPGARLIRSLSATFLSMPVPVQVHSPLAEVRYRSIVSARDTLDFANPGAK